MNKKILLIDDKDEWRDFAEAELTRAGLEIVAPNNISEFCSLQNLRRRLLHFDLIIVDAVLEKDDAIDILFRIREVAMEGRHNYPQSTISVCARLDIRTVVEYMKIGIQNVSLKPYEPEALLSTVKTALLESERANRLVEGH